LRVRVFSRNDQLLSTARAGPETEGVWGQDVPIAVSIGVAQWTREVGVFPDRLIAAADHALYVAKKEGKNRHAVYELSPPLAPEPAAVAEMAERRRA